MAERFAAIKDDVAKSQFEHEGFLEIGGDSANRPPDCKQVRARDLLPEFPLDAGNQFIPALIDFVLRFEQRAALLGAVGLKGFDLLLAGELLRRSWHDVYRLPRQLEGQVCNHVGLARWRSRLQAPGLMQT